MDISQIEFKIVESTMDCDDMKPGEAIVFSYGEGKGLGLILCCPACGKAGSSATGNHQYNPETKTVTPSLNNKCCGWHGFLQNGKFKNA